MTRALIVAEATDVKRQQHLADVAEAAGHELVGIVATAAEGWQAALAGVADVVLVDVDDEVPVMRPRFESAEAHQRVKDAERGVRRTGRVRRPEILDRGDQAVPDLWDRAEARRAWDTTGTYAAGTAPSVPRAGRVKPGERSAAPAVAGNVPATAPRPGVERAAPRC